MAGVCYVLDTNALVDLHDHFAVKNLRRQLSGLCKEKRLKIPEGVRREIRRKTDLARKTVEQLDGKYRDCIVLVRKVVNLASELARVEQAYGKEIRIRKRKYPGFWKSRSGQKAVDGQVVSIAKKLACTVVSDDRAVRLACLLENIPCIAWSEFARQIGLSQPTLFEI